MVRRRNRRHFIAIPALVAVALALAGWLFSERYFLRIMPLPQAALGLLYSGPLAAPTPMKPGGDFVPSSADITTEDGLRQALDALQELSPTTAMPTRPPVADFAGWIELMRKAAMQCTDGSQLFQLIAWNQGIEAREWWLLPPGWPPGGGHSLVEFRIPKSGRWRLVDAQHAATFADEAGEPLDMRQILARWSDGSWDKIAIDYGRSRDAMLAGERGPTVEDYLFKMRLLDQAVINQRPPGYIATATRNDPVIAWAVLGGDSRHDPRVLWTKLAGLALALCLFGALALTRRSGQRR